MASILLPVSKNIWQFDPTTIASCRLWFDAADASSVTLSGSNVTAWRNKSVNGGSVTPTANAFQYVQTFNGSYPAISGVSTGGNGTIGSIASVTLSNPSTVFAVFQNTGLNSGTTSLPYLFNITSTTNRAYAYAYNQTTTPGLMRVSAGVGSADSATNVNTTTSQVFSMEIGASSTLTYQNGTLITTSAITGGSLTGTITIGGNNSLNAWTGFFCEFIIFNNALITAERQQIEGYLAWKWGLQATLPATHPYLNTYQIVRPFLRTFQPTDPYRNCALWFDGGDATSLTLSGSTVTTWRDKSGNANNITSFTATAPTYDLTTGFVNFTSGTGTTTSAISLTSLISYTVFYVVTFFSALTDTGLAAFARAFQLSGTPSFFIGINRQVYTTAVSGASISGSNTTYNVTNTTGLTTGKTVTIAGITLGSATGYNGTGVVQSFVTSTSITVSITSTGTPTSFVGATARNGTDNVNYYVEGNAGSGPFFFYASGQGFNTYAGNTFVVSFSQTGATSYVLSVNGNASALTAATATMANRQVVIGNGAGSPFGVGEVLLYDGALSSQDRQRVESYLIWKWKAQRTSYPGANTNFAVTHPFYKFPTPTTTPFDPRIITGIFGWYDGADSSTLTGNAPVTQWNDKSGNGYNLTSTSGPVRLSTSDNPCGFNIVFVNLLNSFISKTSGISLTGVTTFSCFVVLKDLGDTTSFGRFVSAGTTSDGSTTDNTGFSIAHQTTNTSIVIQKFQGAAAPYSAVTQSASVTGSLSAPYSIISFTSGTELDSFLNGTQVASSPTSLTSPTYNFTQFSIGRDVSTANPLDGIVNEVVTYTTTLTATERRQVEGYLAWKWGLQASLPTTHPYYKVPI
jgi:hypothetical protein